MTFLYDANYTIEYFDHTMIDEKFYNKTYELSNKFPFKWYIFINKILTNPSITYFKDTTMIVNLLELENSNVKILFEILKEYFRNGLVKKLLYKKEFIIVHFHSYQTKEVFENKNLWLSIYLYYTLKNNYDNIRVYYKGQIKEKDNLENVDLIVEYSNNTYLINASKPLSFNSNNIICIYLYNELHRFLNIPTHNTCLKFSFDPNQLLLNFAHLKKCEMLA